ncbi:MAG: AI-2E family transporter, partial [Pedosphaera parvula]|nr:AI-2E family transporter [Pedosphaera parvula]
GWLHLATPLITALFSYLALTKLNFGSSGRTAVGLFIILVLGISYGFVFFTTKALVAAPKIAASAIPAVIDFAQEHGLQLPFEDVESLKSVLLNYVKSQFAELRHYAGVILHELAFLIMGLVVAAGLFLNARFDLDREGHAVKNNLYSLTSEEIAARFQTFFQSFATVMGAQVLISAINTALTAIFLLFADLPFSSVLIGLTFLCGLFPIIGNVISNTIIVGVALTVSPNQAMAALVFLVVLHKLECFLNSKIIGDRIKNPMWLTLLGLILGKRLMGIPGMILAPVILNYVKVEATQRAVTDHDEAAAPRSERESGGTGGKTGPRTPPPSDPIAP